MPAPHSASVKGTHGKPAGMFEVLSTAGALPVDAVGWIVTLLALIVAAAWIRYFYR